jgi:orotidine-5'-phosphate decarboxylase
MTFNQAEFDNFVIDNRVIGVFEHPITLKSGRVSNWYVNWRDVAKDAYLLDQLTNFIISYVKVLGLHPDTFYGVPEGATKLGVLLQLKWAQQDIIFSKGSHILAMGRAKPKEHGHPKDKFFVGMPRGKTIVVEDVTTTGGSMLGTLEDLKEAGVEVIAVIGLTNRNEKRDDGKTVKQATEDLGVKYYCLSNAVDLLPKLKVISLEEKEQIKEYFTTYGDKQINFEIGGDVNSARVELSEKEQEARKRVCLPLDGLNTLEEVEKRVVELSSYVGLFKIGKESYTRFGPEVVKLVHSLGSDVFLDLKYHDIPNTVKGAAKAAAELGVYMFNVHACGGLEMMKAAVEGARLGAESSGNKKPRVIAVSVLTSLDQKSMNCESRVLGTVNEQVLHLAQLSHEAGLDGVVCSAADLQAIKRYLPKDFMYVTPGIKGPNTEAGEDQKRIATPGNAIEDGSSILVIGRAITAAKDRVKAAKEVLGDMDAK